MRKKPRARRSAVLLAAVLLVGVAGTPAEIQRVAAAEETAIKVTRDLRYGGRDGVPLLLDVYRPTAGRDLPVLILVHGGSWRSGDKADWADLALSYAAEGYTVLAPNYRLAPRGGDTLFPGAVHDLSLALQWARRRADEYRGDPTRVGMLGSSAGAHLSLLASGVDGDRPDAVGLFSPPVDLELLWEQGVLVKAITNFLGCEPAECPRRYRLASGLRAVDRQSPPTFLSFSTNELIPSRQGRLLVQEMKESEVPYRVVELWGARHGLAVARATFGRTLNFLNNHL